MEKALQTAANAGSAGWNIYSFLKYSVPGSFTALWVIISASRVSHLPSKALPIIDSDTALLSYLHGEWSGIIGIVLALGIFIGVIFVGLDPIIRAFMGSRGLNFAFRNLMSSKPVDFAYFQFMRLHDVMKRYERIPRRLVDRGLLDKNQFGSIVDGDYSSRYLFRETIQNYYWDQCLDKTLRADLAQRWDQSSMFIYLSFSSLLLFVFQTFFYGKHMITTPLADWSRLPFTDFIPFVLLGYVAITVSYNAYHGKIVLRHRKQKQQDGTSKIWKRKALVVTSLVAYIAFCTFFHMKIQALVWLSSFDVLLFAFFFLTFVSFYWSGTFQFSRYVLSFEQFFRQHEIQIGDFAKRNLDLLKETDLDWSRKTEEAVLVKEQRDFLRCSNCQSPTINGFSCPKCKRIYCIPCGASLCRTCPHCQIDMTRMKTEYR